LLFANGVPDGLFVVGWSEEQARHAQATAARDLEEQIRLRIREATEAGQLLPVAVLEVDGIARINEMLGFRWGERARRAAYQRILALLPAGACLASLGGNEFALTLRPCGSPQPAKEEARLLLSVFQVPFPVRGREQVLSARLGLVLAPIHGTEPEPLLRFAETALRCLPAHDPNRVAVFDPRWLTTRQETRRLESEIPQALRQGEFELVFQPQVGFDGVLAGVEALAQWRHPRLGLVPPSRFIPLAESGGHIRELGEWALRRAATQASEWRRRGLRFQQMAVNVSPTQFAQSGFTGLVSSILAETGLPEGCLELEITESAVLAARDDAERRLQAISALGVSLCLDDFGVGYSSLHHLVRLPLNRVKIDRSFVEMLEKQAEASDLIGMIVQLAHNRGMVVVAEGIESAKQARILEEAGCDLGQGYWFSRPVEASQMEAWLDSGHSWSV
jgi:EAL domain-containing protein (putative c-di-GMP-specific phosphodiesterase class I)/GGDEF domain-containing protein